MFYKKLHIVIALVATLAAAVISILQEDDIYGFSVKIVVTALIFYVLGSIVKTFLDKKVFNEKPESEETGKPADNDADDE